MKKFGIILGTIAVLIVVLIVARILVFPADSWRYRFTIEVETPEGVKVGSVVRQVDVGTGMKFGDSSGARMFTRGEALAVDLGERGVLFAPVNSPPGTGYGSFFEAFPYPGSKNGPLSGIATREGIDYYSSLVGQADLPISKLVLLVRFRDISDPMTVEVVDPKDLSKSFGAGVKFKSATIEIVDRGTWPFNAFGITGEPLTTGIEKKLGWLKLDNPIFIDWKKYPADHPLRSLNKSTFVSGS